MEVLIVVEGGIADVREVPEGVRVRVIDYDPESIGDPKVEYLAIRGPQGQVLQQNVD